ncbi:MAG: hypothetical protein H7Y18_01420 [Clostridiaceae bacterium]|nr:hypothetical protein [Clostridiaceae bacterium]
MDDKMFELLEKIYVEVKGHTEQFKNVENRLDNLESKVDGIENDIKKLSIKIDSELIPNAVATLDGYKDNSEHLTIIDDKIDRLQIDVNSISMKTTYNDTRIIEISKDLKKAK